MDLNTELNRQFSPVGAMIIYQRQVDQGYNKATEFYIEHHEMDKDGKLMAGAPLTSNATKELGNYFIQQKLTNEAISGVIPDFLLSVKMNNNGLPDMVWYRPAQYTEMLFDASLNIPNGFANVPPLVFKAEQGSLSVFAIKDEQRPVDKSPLFCPPFHNCSSDGSVCLGNAKLKRADTKTWLGIIELWEMLFWRSEFTHLRNTSINGNINSVWRALVNNPASNFDLSLLKTSHRNLSNIL